MSLCLVFVLSSVLGRRKSVSKKLQRPRPVPNPKRRNHHRNANTRRNILIRMRRNPANVRDLAHHHHHRRKIVLNIVVTERIWSLYFCCFVSFHCTVQIYQWLKFETKEHSNTSWCSSCRYVHSLVLANCWLPESSALLASMQLYSTTFNERGGEERYQAARYERSNADG